MSFFTDYLASLTESVSGTVTISVSCNGNEGCKDTLKDVRLLLYDRWEGTDMSERRLSSAERGEAFPVAPIVFIRKLEGKEFAKPYHS